jgi:hypothetical protein
MATSYTSLLGLALPVTGELAGTWGDTVNNAITSLLDTAVAGTTTLSTDADVTLSTTVGATNQARQAILLCSGARAAQRTITAPAQSKIYAVVNNTTGGFAVKIVGVGPTTGVTVANGKTAIVIWNGADFVEVAPATATTATNLAGGAAGSVPYQTGAGATTMLGIGAQYRVLTSTGSAPQWSNELQNFISISSTGNITGKSLTAHPTLIGKIDPYDIAAFSNTTGSVGIGRYAAGSGFTTLGQIFFISGGSTQRASLTCAEEASGAAAYLAFATRDASNVLAERVRISAAGNVGIGTSSPTAKVDIQGTGAVALLCNQRTDTTSISTPLMFKTAGNNYWALRQSSAALTFYQDTAIGGTATEYMRIDSAGNLGVGTNNPTEFVYISKSQDAVTRTRTDNSSTGTAAQAQFSLRNSAASLASFGLTGGSFTTSGIFRQDGAYLTTGGAGGLTLGTQAAQPIYFATNSAERMRIDSAGNVGISNASPTARLDVNGTVRAYGGAYSSNQAVTAFSASIASNWTNRLIAGSDSGGSPFFAIQVASDATNGSTERMRIDSVGNVGIGTATPASPLTVYALNNQAALRVTNGPSANNVGITLESTGGNVVLNNGNGPFELSTGGSIRAVVTAAGNVGIGTNAPAYRLDVQTGAGTVANFAAPLTNRALLRSTDGTYIAKFGASPPEAYVLYGAESNHPVAFTTNNIERMRIDSAGNVGIGTASPGTRLDIANTGAGTKGGEVIIRNSSARQTGNYAQLAFAPNADYTGSVVGAFIQGLAPNANANNPCDLVFGSGLGGAPTERMRIDSNGSVGIGNASPGSVVPAALVIDQVNSRTGIAIRCTATTGTDNSTEVRMFGYDGAATTVIGQLTAADSAHATLANSVILRANRATGYLRFDTGGSNERMRISAAGVVGVGTSAPSAWAEKAIDLGSYGSVYGGGANFGAASNLYYNGANWIYKNTAAGSVLNLSSGGMLVYTAASGTAGATATLTQALTLTSASNLKIGGSAERATTVGTNHLDIFNGTAPVGTLTNGISIYSSSGEAYVMDAAGNATLFSPHDAETNEWIFKSKHTPTGKVLKIDVEKMLRFINDHFGLDAIHEFTE